MSDEKNSKYLDPDRTPLEADPSPDDKFFDPDQTPLEVPSDPIYDPDLNPLDGSETVASLFRKTFGSVENVQLDDIQLRRSGSTIEIFDSGEWKRIPEEKVEAVRTAIERFREKSRE
jgi:hypothetical protein